MNSLESPGVKKALPRYRKVVLGEEEAKFLLAKDLLEREKIAFKILENCGLCERKCQVDRTKDKLGFCQADLNWRIFGAHSHYGEESIFIPSATLFAAGCTLRCVFCQNAPESITPSLGTIWNEEEVINWIKEKSKECLNLNLVGGDPTPYLWNILKVLKEMRINIPIIWNSNFYMSEKTMDLLKGIVDVYLSDFKYGNSKCAERLSKVPGYFEIVKRNHLLAFKDSEMVIRHLILSNHVECCSKPVLDFIAENFKDKAMVNIMDQYRPCYKAREYEEINRTITGEEFNKVVDYAKKEGLNFIV